MAKLGRRDAKAFQLSEDRILLGDRGPRSVATVNLFEQTTKTAGDFDQPRLEPLPDEGAGQPFEQPCAERVKLANIRDVDLDQPGA